MRPTIALFSAVTLAACATGPNAVRSINQLSDREAADYTQICITPPRVVSDLRGAGIATGPNGLLPLQTRRAACVSSPAFAYEAYMALAPLDPDHTIYSRPPQAATLPLPVDQEGVMIVAIADSQEELSGYQLLANGQDYSCSALVRVVDGDVISYDVRAHRMSDENPTLFDTLDTLQQANRMTQGGFPCAEPLRLAAEVLQRPGFDATIQRSFAIRMARGPRHES